jgi:hypothetical protein
MLTDSESGFAGRSLGSEAESSLSGSCGICVTMD